MMGPQVLFDPSRGRYNMFSSTVTNGATELTGVFMPYDESGKGKEIVSQITRKYIRLLRAYHLATESDKAKYWSKITGTFVMQGQLIVKDLLMDLTEVAPLSQVE